MYVNPLKLQSGPAFRSPGDGPRLSKGGGYRFPPPGGSFRGVGNRDLNRDLNRTLIPQEGCRKVGGILSKLADRRKKGLRPILSGRFLSLSPLLSELKVGGPTRI